MYVFRDIPKRQCAQTNNVAQYKSVSKNGPHSQPPSSIFILISCWRRTARLDHVLEQLEARLGRGLALRERQKRQHRRVTDQTRVRVAHNVGLPLPARRVRVTCANVFLLEPFELLLCA